MAKKTIPVNNYNDSDNYGTSGAAPSLYSDKHYLDGDGFLYGLGMASQRMIVKGKGDDIDTNHFAWTSASTTGKLILRVDNLVSGGLVTANSGNRLAVNPGNGLYIDATNQNKLAVSLFKKQKTPQSTPYNASGLEFATGAEWGGAPAAGQLRIKLADLSMDGTNFDNVSGLILQDPYDTESGATQFHGTGGLKVNYGDGLTLDNSLKLTTALYTKKADTKNESGLTIASDSTTHTGGLKINTGKALYIGVDSADTAAYGKLNVLYDNITIKLDNQNRLKVDATAIPPNILPSNPITVEESGNNKTIGLKLKNTTESGHTIYASGLDADSNGLFVKLGDNSIVNGNNGLFVDWSNFPKGNGIYYNEQTGLFETDIDPTAGLTFTPSGSVVINLSASTGNNPLIFNQTDGGLDLVFDDSLRGDGTYGMASGETGLGVSLYRSANGTNLSGIEFVSGDSTHNPGLKVKAYHGITVNNNGVSVKPKSNSGIAVDANGVSVKIKPTSGIGVDSNGIYLKVATTSEIGGVKTGTPATIPETNTVDIPLFLDSNNVGWVRTNVFTQKAPASGSAGEFPYSASYIDTNYSTKTEVTAEIAAAVSDISGREYKIFPTLPAKGESQSWADFYAAYKKYIALVSNTGTAPDAYKEYILIVTNESTGECHWEQIGDTEFTTDNFVAKTDVLTQAEVASIVQDVFGF